MIADKIYDSSTGKFRRTCTNPLCIQPFWGRKDQQYCSRRCKNQVNNAKWRKENPKLTDIEKDLRRNHRILLNIANQHGYNKWVKQEILKVANFNGKLYHSFSEITLDNGMHCNILAIFDLKLYVADNKQILIKTSL